MITNGSLLQISTRTGASADGQETFLAGGAIAVDAFIDDVSSSQRFTLGAKISDANRVCFIEAATLQAASLTPPVEGDKLTICLENGSPFTGQILITKNPTLNELTHYVFFLKVA